jgi:lipopolysaccharide transport system permease protein
MLAAHSSGEMMQQTQVLRPASLSLRALKDDLARLVSYRDLFLTLLLHRLRVRYRQSSLGYIWAVLQPVSMVAIYTLVFAFFARVPTGDTPYVVFAFSALVPWLYFANGLSLATNGLVTNASLVLKVYFPREIVPLSYIGAAFVDFCIGCAVLALTMAIYGVRPHGTLVWIVLPMAVATVFLIGASLLCAAVEVRHRDVGLAMPLLLQLWLFATPVLYPLQAVPARLQPFYTLNPMVAVVDGFRSALVLGLRPDLHLLGRALTISLLVLVFGYLWFKRAEATFADEI